MEPRNNSTTTRPRGYVRLPSYHINQENLKAKHTIHFAIKLLKLDKIMHKVELRDRYITIVIPIRSYNKHWRTMRYLLNKESYIRPKEDDTELTEEELMIPNHLLN